MSIGIGTNMVPGSHGLSNSNPSNLSSSSLSSQQHRALGPMSKVSNAPDMSAMMGSLSINKNMNMNVNVNANGGVGTSLNGFGVPSLGDPNQTGDKQQQIKW